MTGANLNRVWMCLLMFAALTGGLAHAAPAAKLAYIGPGAGLGMLGSLIAVVCVLALALIAPIIFVVRLVIGLFRGVRPQDAQTTTEVVSADPAANDEKVSSTPSA